MDTIELCDLVNAEDIKRFKELLEKLKSSHPDSYREAKSLGEKCVSTRKGKSVNDLWDVFWQKPIYANLKVEIAEKKIRSVQNDLGDLARLQKEIKRNAWDVHYERRGTWNANKNYTVVGEKAKKLVDGGLARWRLFSILNAANWLNSHGNNIDKIAHQDMTTREVYGAFSEGLGLGWGSITKLHLMTDFCLSVKPDRWLQRAVHYISDGRFGSTGGNIQDDKCLLEIVDYCSGLTLSLAGLTLLLDSSDFRSRRRQLDKELMEIGRCGLLPV